MTSVMKKKIVFMGTPFFASEVLKSLVSNDDIEIVAVVTQPDRKVGRKQKVVYSEVKETALSLNIPIYQPLKIVDFLNDLISFNPDGVVTCAYGQFLPKSILVFNVINIHASLLPRHRGGAPMQHAIMRGDLESGISLMKSVLKMDAGPVYVQESVSISEDDTLTTLELKLIDCAVKLINLHLVQILDGEIEAIKQDQSKATFSPTIQAQDELLNFNLTSKEVYNHARALIDNPYSYALLDKKRVKFTKVAYDTMSPSHPIGTILFDQKESFKVVCQNGHLIVYECQMEGKTKLPVSQLYNGYHKQLHLRRFNDEN